MASTRIAELSSLIATHTDNVDAYLAAIGSSSPSFEPGQSSNTLTHEPIAASRQIILDATDELHALMLGPAGILTSPFHNSLISLHAICHFGLATKFLPNKESASFAEIADGTSLNESMVRRIIRHAASYRIFREPRKGFVEHTGASKFLAENYDMRQWIGMVSEEMWPAATKTVKALEEWPGSDEPNHAGFNIAHRTDKLSFDVLSSDPDREQRYAAAMKWFSTSPSLEPAHIVNGYDWARLGKATVVDVGGSHGSLSIALSSAFPNLSCIVQDRAEVVEVGRANLPATVEGHVSFMEHDFFKEQPTKAAAVYILRWILHDWSDTYAIKILRALTPALVESSKVLICESVLPDPGSVSTLRDRTARSMDLSMLEFHNGKERDHDDWVELLHVADPRYRLISIRQPPLSRLALLEVGWRRDATTLA